jgi:uncharacterized protein (DUF58 family)
MSKFLTKRNVLLLLTVLFFFIAWNRTINLLYGMFALLAATLVLAHVLPWYSLRGVVSSRSLPTTAFEGNLIDICIDVRNSSMAGRSMIEVVDTFPAAGPGAESPMTFIARLGGRKKRSYSFKLQCYKRGEYRIGPLALTSSYPLGISTARKEMIGSEVPLLVFPEVFDIVKLPLVSGSTAPMSGVEAASKSGGSEEFFGTREYRQGDSLRYIHWPSTARHSQLIVKEFEIRASVEVTIVIDLHRKSEIGKGKETTLEYAVKIAASTAKYSLDRGHTVQLACYGKAERIIPAAKGFSQLAQILDALAKVTADGNIPFPHAVNRASEMMRDGSTAVLVFSDSYLKNDQLAYSLNLLKSRRIRPVCVVLDDASFSGPLDNKSVCADPHGLIADGVPNYRISRGASLREVFAL